MNANAYDITVLGAGSYGSALAISIARNGNKTLLWGHEADHVEQLIKERSNEAFLPGIPFPDTLALEADLATAVGASKNILVVVPSFAFGDVLQRMKPHLQKGARVAWATKGLEADTGRLLQDVAKEILGDSCSLAVISGPTFAMEVAKGLPTAIAVASTDDDFATKLTELMHNDSHFRVYRNQDFIGLQLGGAVKNVIAIGAGLADGLGFGANARTALITRGLAEMIRLGEALGAQPSSFNGMGGLGDLVLTCTDNQSRNRRFGLALGAGQSLQEAEQGIGQVVEGYRNTKEVYLLAKRLEVEMPITEQLYQVLYQGKPPKQAAAALLSRDQTFE
ncbi:MULTISPECIES: NAD(P)H-dependent glycerol-3-phosphate dehydrogenase [Corallincola]|uniref:Glycerol-3-phosphate dehydrogenase [NAD(P)+] n=3 Tax=Corallincola TaxID=1775176 RepID=A0A368NKN1_9GAMM|nr:MULTISPECIES: NAD(P)H-dependent glycerol-3-phosphate dehydrogenase [Corallincola]RCU51167.1 NAD(P)H-dependent glycerol-3-phosphate dehydrogenase [Corallincola holothuriorum]TAA45916.1 NAD(P)H-dependent glycerol-3-phosphate dehydrogenase [Corallincola spongiicola]TCI04142.1 NAD(P)H-dependent glycerol-3-phosphate dehydrogenase [Corallincola luteus]